VGLSIWLLAHRVVDGSDPRSGGIAGIVGQGAWRHRMRPVDCLGESRVRENLTHALGKGCCRRSSQTHGDGPRPPMGNLGTEAAGPTGKGCHRAGALLHRRHFARETGTREPSRNLYGEGQGRCLGTWSGRRGTLRRRGQKAVVGTGETLLGPVLWGQESGPAHPQRARPKATPAASSDNQAANSWWPRGSRRGRSSDEGRDNITRSERRAPPSSVHDEGGEGR
jgi:hypothetical protein